MNHPMQSFFDEIATIHDNPIRRVYATEDGREALDQIMRWCKLSGTSADLPRTVDEANDPLWLADHEARRDIGRKICAALNGEAA